jgi:rare lipoprotein A
MVAIGVALGAGGFVSCSRSASVAFVEPPTVRSIASVPASVIGHPSRSERPTKMALASWYGPRFASRKTANGELFDPSQLTAASMTLPLGTRAKVTNLENGRSTVVRINDRGPHVEGRDIDLSRRAAQKLGFKSKGTAHVEIRVLQTPSRTKVCCSPQHIDRVNSRFDNS